MVMSNRRFRITLAYLALLGAGAAATLVARIHFAAKGGYLRPLASQVEVRGAEAAKSEGKLDTPAVFEVRNEGHSPVTILNVETSCTCLSVDVEPRVVQPGQAARVVARVESVRQGQSNTSVVLHTDSAIIRDVVLTVRVLGSRRPPYLADATGDLVFVGEEPWTETRSVSAATVVPRTLAELVPGVQTDLSFLELTLIETKKVPSLEPDCIAYVYTYRVGFRSRPPAGLSLGSVQIRDPWNSADIRSLAANVQVLSSFRVAPTHVVIHAKRTDRDDARASLLVRTQEPASVIIEPESPDACPIRIEQQAQKDSSSQVARFDLILPRESPGSAAGEWKLLVRDSESTAPIEVPVRVVLED